MFLFCTVTEMHRWSSFYRKRALQDVWMYVKDTRAFSNDGIRKVWQETILQVNQFSGEQLPRYVPEKRVRTTVDIASHIAPSIHTAEQKPL